MSTRFGQLVQLVFVAIGRMGNFLVFMLIWIAYFALAYYILGS